MKDYELEHQSVRKWKNIHKGVIQMTGDFIIQLLNKKRLRDIPPRYMRYNTVVFWAISSIT